MFEMPLGEEQHLLPVVVGRPNRNHQDQDVRRVQPLPQPSRAGDDVRRPFFRRLLHSSPQFQFPTPLFPDSLQQICMNALLTDLQRCGHRIRTTSSASSAEEDEDGHEDESTAEATSEVRDLLASCLASGVLDDLAGAAEDDLDDLESNVSRLFCLSVLCNGRLSRLVACSHLPQNPGPPPAAPAAADQVVVVEASRTTTKSNWARFIENHPGALASFTSCIGRLTGLTCLTIHEVATDQMLLAVASACAKLQVLDVSHSQGVSDLGLSYIAAAPCRRYLREFHLELDHQAAVRIVKFSPAAVSGFLASLRHLAVMNIPDLHEGIREYRVTTSGKALNLVHYVGPAESLLSEVVEVRRACPKLRTLKLWTAGTELDQLGLALASSDPPMALDSVTLAYTGGQVAGLKEFVEACGAMVCGTFGVVVVGSAAAVDLTHADLEHVARNCRNIDTLVLTGLRMAAGPPPSPRPAEDKWSFRYLTTLRLSEVRVAPGAKDMLRALLSCCPDLEKLHLTFYADDVGGGGGYFFNDLFLEEVLRRNPMGRLTEFVVENCALTLISALRLLRRDSHPKLCTVGALLRWDVEPCELEAFERILRKAKGLDLLPHHINLY